IDRLRGATAGLYSGGKSVSTYDRYTVHRLLSQLSTDSAPERDDRININYKNTDGLGATNLIGWQPLEFFTNVAHRLLRDEFPMVRRDFGTNADLYDRIYTNLMAKRIPVLINGLTQFTNADNVIQRIYSPRIHQLIQLSANIYEATQGGKSDE